MNTTIFDIETGPLPEEKLLSLMPAFDPDPRLKDPAKVQESINSKREAWIRDAALSAITGQILAIGYIDNDSAPAVSVSHEVVLLEEFWEAFGHCDRFVGFNSHSFDLPFALRRSMILGVKYPRNLLERNRYWHSRCVDLREVWLAGEYRGEGSLDAISRAMGFGGKIGNGANFARLLETNRDEAMLYLENDIVQTAMVHDRIFPEYRVLPRAT